MIEINLLPEELKVKRPLNTKFTFILYFVSGLFLTILLLLNIFVISLSAVKNIELTILNKKWETLMPQRQKLEESKKSSEILTQDLKAIQQAFSLRTPWSNKMNKLSLLLPSGVWFNEVSLNNKNFTIKGSVISLKKEEMSLINLLLKNLKEDIVFFSDFNNLDLTSVQRRALGGYEVVDFTLNGSIKDK